MNRKQTSPAGLQSLVVTFDPVPQVSNVVSMSVSAFASLGRLPFAHNCIQHIFMSYCYTPQVISVV